jgi:hypothetical protein
MKRMNVKSKKGGKAPALNSHKHFKGDGNARPRQEAKKCITQDIAFTLPDVLADM